MKSTYKLLIFTLLFLVLIVIISEDSTAGFTGANRWGVSGSDATCECLSAKDNSCEGFSPRIFTSIGNSKNEGGDHPIRCCRAYGISASDRKDVDQCGNGYTPRTPPPSPPAQTCSTSSRTYSSWSSCGTDTPPGKCAGNQYCGSRTIRNGCGEVVGTESKYCYSCGISCTLDNRLPSGWTRAGYAELGEYQDWARRGYSFPLYNCYTSIGSARACTKTLENPVRAGNGVCEAGETCQTTKDCRESGWVGCCGNGACDYGETTTSCSLDCGPSRSSVYKNEPRWCQSWCYADNNCGSGYNSCGAGYGKYSTLCCPSSNFITMPSGITCGTDPCRGVCTQNSHCSSTSQVCQVSNGQCISNPCGAGQAWDGGKCTCTSNAGCDQFQVCSSGSCGEAPEICWNGIDDNNKGACTAGSEKGRRCSIDIDCPKGACQKIDESCGGCADLDNDSDVDLDDFFILADIYRNNLEADCGGNVDCLIKFHKLDWNDDGIVEWEVDGKDWTGRDGSCWKQNFGARGVSCGNQLCSSSAREEVCKTNSECFEEKVSCSFGKDGKLTRGHCCREGSWWVPNENKCGQSAAKPCDLCGEDLIKEGKLNLAFFDDEECFSISKRLACIKTDIYSDEIKPFKLEIFKK